MKNLYEPETLAGLQARLTPAGQRQWGRMTTALLPAHCALGIEWAVDDRRPPRMFVGRLFGAATSSSPRPS